MTISKKMSAAPSVRILAHSGISSLSHKGLRSVFAGYVRVPSFELYVLSSHGAYRAPESPDILQF